MLGQCIERIKTTNDRNKAKNIFSEIYPVSAPRGTSNQALRHHAMLNKFKRFEAEEELAGAINLSLEINLKETKENLKESTTPSDESSELKEASGHPSPKP